MSFHLLLFYNLIVVPILYLIFWLGGVFNEKIKRRKKGRRGVFRSLRSYVAQRDARLLRLWIHASSMGEFEQVKPVIAAVRSRLAAVSILVSFSSPSAYEHVGKYGDADCITYLPLDSYWNARRFVNLVRPHLAIFVRHDIWPNHIVALKRSGTKTVLMDAALSRKLNPGSIVGRVIGKLLYCGFDYLLAISSREGERLSLLCPDMPHIEIFGDTRYDQVFRRSLERDRIANLLRSGDFAGPVIVAGSTWPSDEEKVLPALIRLCGESTALRVIVIPHEPTESHLTGIEKTLCAAGMRSIRLSQWSAGCEWTALLVDSVGLLANIYALGQIAYVGGSFGPGVHNVLEPAVYGCPILFGPRIQNSVEAGELVERGGGYIIHTSEDFYIRTKGLLENPAQQLAAAAVARGFVEGNRGATDRTLALIEVLLA